MYSCTCNLTAVFGQVDKTACYAQLLPLRTSLKRREKKQLQQRGIIARHTTKRGLLVSSAPYLHVRRWGGPARVCVCTQIVVCADATALCAVESLLSHLVVCQKGLEVLVGCCLLREIQGRGDALVRLLDLIKPVGRLHIRHLNLRVFLRLCPHHLVHVCHHPAWCYPRSRGVCLANPRRARSDVPRAAHGGCEREPVG